MLLTKPLLLLMLRVDDFSDVDDVMVAVSLL